MRIASEVLMIDRDYNRREWMAGAPAFPMAACCPRLSRIVGQEGASPHNSSASLKSTKFTMNAVGTLETELTLGVVTGSFPLSWFPQVPNGDWLSGTIHASGPAEIFIGGCVCRIGMVSDPVVIHRFGMLAA